MIDTIRDAVQAFLAEQRAILDASNWGMPVRRSLKQAVTEGDAQFFVERSTLSLEEAERMIRAIKTSPPTESAAIILPALRSALSKSDWRSFRKLLLESSCGVISSYKDIDVTLGDTR